MPQTVSDGVQIGPCAVRLLKGDITEQDVDAFVFYAQSDLALGSGFGTIVSVRGGSSIQKELQDLGPVEPCGAVISGAGKLKPDYIIHAVGPTFQEEDIEGKLRTTMLNTLKLADEKELRRIAFPAMGAGYYGIPANVCARVMLEAIRTHVEGKTGIEELVFAVLDTPQYDAFEAQLATVR